MLVVAQQPLRLSELSNALSTRNNAEDFSHTRVPNMSLVEDLCGTLVKFDRSSKGSQEDPLLKLAHKSIQDFFFEDPQSIDVPNNLSQFFVSLGPASQDMGLVCLTYLSYLRYQKPIDVSKILGNDAKQEHAFLKYAARFWFQHLIHTSHSKALFSTVERFIHSPAFWTCITVQSHVAPHVFSRLTEMKEGHYALTTTGPGSRGQDPRINFAFPLPDWLDEYGVSGTTIVQRYLAFVKEWHPVLTSHPHAIDQCIGDVIGSQNFPVRNTLEAQRMQVVNISKSEPRTSGTYNQYLGSITSEEEELNALILEGSEADLKGDIVLEHVRNLADESSACSVFHRSIKRSTQSSIALHVIFDESTKDPVLWHLDPEHLNLIAYHNSGSKSYEVPNSLGILGSIAEHHFALPAWIINAKFSGRTTNGEAVAFYCTKASKCEDEIDGSGFKYDNSDSDSYSDTNSDSGYNSESVLDADSEDCNCHCLVIVHQEGPPLWTTWKTKGQTRLQISCAFHPTQPIAIWSYTQHEFSVADLQSGRVKSGILPEPVEVQLLSATAVCKGEASFLVSTVLLKKLANQSYQNSDFRLAASSYTIFYARSLQNKQELLVRFPCPCSNSRPLV